ncbi:uncharacterized protein [Eleutherodactylus coqui]|uniref:uncharacterized protein n=1 Tax=Eleutherodactylus coqui TaxID=57060 RepID=UPI0034627B91
MVLPGGGGRPDGTSDIPAAGAARGRSESRTTPAAGERDDNLYQLVSNQDLCDVTSSHNLSHCSAPPPDVLSRGDDVITDPPSPFIPSTAELRPLSHDYPFPAGGPRCSCGSHRTRSSTSSCCLLLNDPPRMDKERNEITEILLNAALEIIYLLTGEDYTAVKTSGDSVTTITHLQESGGWSRTPGPITEPPLHLLTNKEKILELTKKMTELLTGEDEARVSARQKRGSTAVA